MTTTDRVLTAEIAKRELGARHPSTMGEWIYATEWLGIDAFAVRCWTSGIGCRRVAYEVKVSRADYLRELRRPEKRSRALGVSHQFFFAMPAELAVQAKREKSLPAEAGLVAIYDRGAYWQPRRLVNAPVRTVPPLREDLVAHLVRHLADPPAVRHALSERQEQRDKLSNERYKRKDAEDERDNAYRAFAVLRGGELSAGQIWTQRSGRVRYRVIGPVEERPNGDLVVPVEREFYGGACYREDRPLNVGRLLVECELDESGAEAAA